MAQLLPLLKARFGDANNDPLSGGKLYSYVAGTTTPLATYADEGEESANSNPVILDANGEANIWLSTGSYKFVLTDADDVIQWTVDNVSPPGTGPAGASFLIGSGAPSSELGQNGDSYLDAVTGELYVKNEGSWTLAGSVGGVPSGGDEGAVLAKKTVTDGDVEWKAFAYDGHSARFNEQFTSTSLADTLDKIIKIQYTAPLVSLSATGSSTIREKGDAVTASTLTASITKRSDPIAEVKFIDVTDSNTTLDTQTSGGGIPDGGNSTYSWTGSFSDSQQFKVEIKDDGSTGGPTTVSATVNFTFVYPYYYGSGASSLAAASVAGLTKNLISSSANLTRSFSPDGTEVLYFAYPASYGDLVSIFDVNNFNTIADWTKRTENITGLDSNAVSYNIYEFNNVPLAGSYEYRFVR